MKEFEEMEENLNTEEKEEEKETKSNGDEDGDVMAEFLELLEIVKRQEKELQQPDRKPSKTCKRKKPSRIPVPTLTINSSSGNTRPRLLSSRKSRIPVPIHTRKNKDEAQNGKTAGHKKIKEHEIM